MVSSDLQFWALFVIIIVLFCITNMHIDDERNKILDAIKFQKEDTHV